VKLRYSFSTSLVFYLIDCTTIQIEDMNSQAQLSAAQQLASGGGGGGGGGATNLENSGVGGEDDDEDEIPELEAPDDEGPIDETGVDPKDVDLVMAQVRCLISPASALPHLPSAQVNCSRAKAVRVLKESGGDLINASESHTFSSKYTYKLSFSVMAASE
jgi:nascent polypeptide-associated complex subunit alpha